MCIFFLLLLLSIISSLFLLASLGRIISFLQILKIFFLLTDMLLPDNPEDIGRDVCFIPKADIGRTFPEVRFVPISLRKSVTTAARVANEGF
jgi:hypothetical protein